MKIALVVLAVLLLVGGAGVRPGRWRTQNGLVTEKAAIDAAWSQVDVALQRRADLIPNLVETVKGFAKHEQAVYQRDRRRARGLGRGADAADKIAANGKLDSALSRLLVVVENYPQLKSQRELSAAAG